MTEKKPRGRPPKPGKEITCQADKQHAFNRAIYRFIEKSVAELREMQKDESLKAIDAMAVSTLLKAATTGDRASIAGCLYSVRKGQNKPGAGRPAKEKTLDQPTLDFADPGEFDPQ
jgi:hypothetical protein